MRTTLARATHLAVAIAIAPAALAAVPQGWTWTLDFPFRELTVAASSEEPKRWPAQKAIDGDTSEPEGIWQTHNNRPSSAWLELRLKRPRRVKGVNIFHQLNPGYYRSIHYTIACWADGAWKTVAEVKNNKKSGWRAHAFSPVETTKVRILIARSEHGTRMGLNEVTLDMEPAPDFDAGNPVSPPHHCGNVADMGTITFDATLPKGTSIQLHTRTAPDANGKPGAWSAWSTPYAASGARVASPLGQWVQFKAARHGTKTATPVLRRVTIGCPTCVQAMRLPDVLIPRPGKPLTATVAFNQPMDKTSGLVGELAVPGQPPTQLKKGAWAPDGRSWTFAPTTAGPSQGLGALIVGGARTRDGHLMMHQSLPLAIGPKPILDRLTHIAEWMMTHPTNTIFVEGYNQRTILGLYEITREKRYLAHVRKWAHKLLDLQKPAGYWGTGYGDVYFADTGSALGLFVNFYKFATPDEKKRIDTAFDRYIDLLLVRGDSTGKPFVHPGGSLGVGYHADKQGNIKSDLNKPYTIATALTGAEIFAALHYMRGTPRYKQIAIKACNWILDTMVGDKVPDPWAQPGQIPYYIDDWNKERKNRRWIWKRWPYDTSAYAGEGFIAAYTYIDDNAFRTDLGRRVRPHIEWLLRTQNPDGSWAAKSSGDQYRSHGVVNFLLWYHHKVQRDPRIVEALRRYYLLLLDTNRSAYLNVPGNKVATSLAGRALLELVKPGVDCYRWKDDTR